MAAALSKHLERLRQSIPGNGGELGGGGGAEVEDFLAKAYPDTDIPLARLQEARAAAARIGGKNFPTGKGRPGTWVTVGPSNALYPATMFRNSFSYVPNDYVAGGRAHRGGHRSQLQQRSIAALWIFAAGGGVWRTKNALSGTAELAIPVGRFRDELGQLDHARSQRSERQHALRRHRRGQRVGRLGRGRRACTSRPTAATPGPARWARRSFAGRAIGSIAVAARQRLDHLRGHDARRRRHQRRQRRRASP